MLKTSTSTLFSTLVTTSHRLHSYLFRVLRYPYTLYIRPQNSHQLRFNFSLSPPGINPLKSPPSYWLCFISRLHTPPPNLWLQHNHYLQLIHLSAWPTSFNLRQALPSVQSLQQRPYSPLVQPSTVFVVSPNLNQVSRSTSLPWSSSILLLLGISSTAFTEQSAHPPGTLVCVHNDLQLCCTTPQYTSFTSLLLLF